MGHSSVFGIDVALFSRLRSWRRQQIGSIQRFAHYERPRPPLSFCTVALGEGSLLKSYRAEVMSSWQGGIYLGVVTLTALGLPKCWNGVSAHSSTIQTWITQFHIGCRAPVTAGPA